MGNSGLGLTQYELLAKWSIFKNATFFSRCPRAWQAVVKSIFGWVHEDYFHVNACQCFSGKNMTLTCTTLDRHEHKNYLRPVFSFYALFDDMWCLLDFNSFPWYYNWPTAGIFCMRKKKNLNANETKCNARQCFSLLHRDVFINVLTCFFLIECTPNAVLMARRCGWSKHAMISWALALTESFNIHT